MKMRKTIRTVLMILALWVIHLAIISIVVVFAFTPVNVRSIAVRYYSNMEQFNEIAALVKSEGEGYLNKSSAKNYLSATKRYIRIHNSGSQISLSIEDYDGEIVEEMSEKLTESMVDTIRNTDVLKVEALEEYFRKKGRVYGIDGRSYQEQQDGEVLIKFQFDAISDAYLVYYEGEVKGQLIAPTTMRWKTQALGGNWYVCNELEPY